MRDYSFGLLIVLFTGCILGGCAKKEVIKAEEQVVPAVVAAPEAPPPVPEPPRPAPPAPVPPPEPVKADVIPAEAPQTTVPVETKQEVTLETIHFDFDKSDLRDPDREILNRNAGILMNTLKGNFQIEGHCDERGSAEYNLALGERRARSAMNYLVTLGVAAERLSIISYGKEKPIDPGHDEDAWAKNRRAQFMKTGD